MEKIRIVEEIQELLDKLKYEMTSLETDIHEILTIISKETFISQNISNRVKNSLTMIGEVENEMRQKYATLEAGHELPGNFTEIQNSLLNERKHLEQKTSLIQVISKFMNMHSNDPKIDQLLEAHKIKLSGLHIRGAENQKNSEQLNHYIAFVNAFEETNPVMIMEHIKKISDFFEADLLAQAAFSKGIYIAAGNENTSGTMGLALEEQAAEVCMEDVLGELEICNSPREDKRFGAKDFKNDLSGINEELKKDILVTVNKHMALTIESLSQLTGIGVEQAKVELEQLIKKGYMRKYAVKNLGDCYCISQRGYKAFNSVEACSFLGVRTSQKELGPEEKIETDNGAVTRIIYAKMFEKECKIRGFTNCTSFQTLLRNAYINGIKLLPLTGKTAYEVIYTGVFTDEADEWVQYFEQARAYFSESSPDTYLIITGYTAVHTKIMADTILSEIGSRIQGSQIFYYDIMKDAYHRYLDDAVVKEDELYQNACGEVGQGDTLNLEEKEETSHYEAGVEMDNKVVEEKSDLEKMDKKEQSVFNAEEQKQIIEDYQDMIVSDKISSATAYLKAAAMQDHRFSPLYQKVAYAVNDPLENCSYASDKILDIYFDEHIQQFEFYMAAALLRNYFFNHIEYDYSMKSLNDNVKEYNVFSEDSRLGNIAYELMAFKDTIHKGIDVYADYRGKDVAAWESEVAKVRKRAKGYHDTYILQPPIESTSHKRLLETRKLIFSKRSDLGMFLKAVIEDEQEMLPLLKDFLKNHFLKNDNSVAFVNLDNDKVNAFMDEYWETAGQNMLDARKTSMLMSRLRNNLFNSITKVVETLCDWAFLMENNIGEDDPGRQKYKKVKNHLIASFNEAIDYFNAIFLEYEGEKAMMSGIAILLFTLKELRSRLDGSYHEGSNNYFYLDFLCDENMLLQESYLPDMNAKFYDLDQFSILSRIKKHANLAAGDLKRRLHEIFTERGDDFGSARLIDKYLSEISGKSIVDEQYHLKASIDAAKNNAKQKKEEFIENLELAQSYGQIDNSTEDKKERILQIVNEWYERTQETCNYGFFLKILEHYQIKIKEEAKVREASIKREVDSFMNFHPELKNDRTFLKKVGRIQEMLEAQNYTVAEDLLNRINSSEPELDHELFETDYVDLFYKEYDTNYRKVVDSGKKLSTVLLSDARANKDTKGGKRLLDNWLSNGGQLGSTKLINLMNGLGFDVGKVSEKTKIGKTENYHVILQKPKDGRKIHYKHPIAVFGSKASEDGFRVVCLYGKFDVSGLIEIFKDLGNTKNTIILLDYALPKPERRMLGKKVKSEAMDKVFGIIDRVMLMFLVNNYTETSINRALMSIMMPFSYYQPYVIDSVNVMPPELFMGRKEELEKIQSPTGVNIVYGGRQLGKSALLRMAKTAIDQNENNDRAVVVEIKGLDYKGAAKKIGLALYDEKILFHEVVTEDWDELAREIKRRLQNDTVDRIPYLLLLLDEADTFIESCEAVNYRPLDALKDIQSVGVARFKFVIAGLRNIVRFKREAALGNNSVLTHLESMTVTPFKLAEARELLEVPLHYLGLRFSKEKESLISLILASTNYFPGLIQLYCAKLVEAMKKTDYAGYNVTDTPPYQVHEGHIKKVLADRGFRQQIREKYEITLKLDEDNYYYIIALILAYLYHTNGYNAGYTPDEIHRTGCEFGIEKIKSLTVDKLAALMEELRELNVLRITSDNCYLYTRYSFFQMMGSAQEVDDKIVEYMED